ncbi:MAG: OB-fold nucleic acid binding domain-containing protein [Methanosarcinaceae archaeon]
MSEKCTECGGNGIKIISTEKCPQCKGTGKAKSVDLMKLSEKGMDSFLQGGASCDKCGGSGEIQITEPCEACKGRGAFYKCKVCGNPIDQLIDGEEVCKTCGGSQVVYNLDESCDMDEVEVGKLYHAIGNSIATFGVFVDFNPHVRGLIHSSNITRTVDVGDDVIVYVKDIKKNGNMDLVPKYPAQYRIIEVEKDLPVKRSSELRDFVRKIVRIEGEVTQIKQTGGPTIFTISDDDGLIMCAAFERAGERAYPDIDSDMIVTIVGEVSLRDDKVQIEVRSIKELTGTKKKDVWDRIENAIDKRSEPDEIEFLVKSEILEKLRPEMKHVAKEIKKAIIKSKPIVLRHHADADGMTAAVAIERAILPLIREVGGADAEYHYYRRAPSKAPFYEMMDITRDLSFALDDAERHGQKMPFVILVDNGSTEEDTPAMKQAQVYGIDMVVIDHHHPDEAVDQYLRAHVNPAHVGGDFGVTTGMLCTEVARMINPGVVDEIKHLPAISAVGDRSEADEARRYIELVSDKYSLEQLKDIALALDFEAFWLKFSSGKNIVDDLMNMGNFKTHEKLVKLLCEQANGMISGQLDTCLPNVKSQPLSNGAILNVLDVEKYAHKFTFPPPGKTSGEVHDRMCRKFEGKPVVTIGFGPDFCVIRSKNVRMNIPQMVRELHDEVVGAGVNGGGHLVVGSIKFVEGMRSEVLSRLVEKISAVEVD